MKRPVCTKCWGAHWDVIECTNQSSKGIEQMQTPDIDIGKFQNTLHGIFSEIIDECVFAKSHITAREWNEAFDCMGKIILKSEYIRKNVNDILS